MRCWSEDWAFHTQTIDMAWDFTSRDPDMRKQHQWCPNHGGYVCRENKLSYTGDRQEGSVHMTFDVGTYCQCLMEDKELLRIAVKERNE